ncbi:MAG TPA: protein translocase subunit SecF [Candidatus Krumholzibacteria bacterium]|nr:protein translocase subunit SecF [Candidatus Krumholzibacteria bacterium]HPD72334.1 protein translocase subunit SecF [Candidatus Krumholzibacteria bacterium]HRY40734.1 protein translocase subunit SecF [Candidatus Krumholzibacteria bacterium]
MEFFRDSNINVVGVMKPVLAISAVLVAATLIWLLVAGGPRLSIDFTGGTIVQVRIAPIPEISAVRSALAASGFAGAEVQEFGAPGEFLITFPSTATEIANASRAMVDSLRDSLPGSQIELRRNESVGPKVGKELRATATNAIALSLVLIAIYMWFRFVLRYGLAAVVALVHDVTLTLGMFKLLNLEVSLSIVAAFLTIIGYSVNDTVVVFDRIRENMRFRRKESYREVVNRSINQTFSRTILTALTTLFVTTTLWLVGGPVIHDFAFALCFGIIIGTYSSIFIAGALIVWWYERVGTDKKRASATM